MLRSNSLIKCDSVYGITVDKSTNIIYFTHETGSLWKYNPHKAKIAVVYRDTESKTLMRGLVWNGGHILYICDRGYHRIFQYNIETTLFSNFAGSGKEGVKDGHINEAQFTEPEAIATDSNGNLYVTEKMTIRKIELRTRMVSTITKNTTQNTLCGIAVCDKIIYYADRKDHCIYKLQNGQRSFVCGIAGVEGSKDGTFEEAQFKNPLGIMAYIGNLIVTDANGLRRVDLEKKIVTTYILESVASPIYSHLTTDSEMNILIGSQGGIAKMVNTWKRERWLWIGHLKEDESYCQLARVPRDIIREIIIFVRHSAMRRGMKRTLKGERIG